MPAIDPHSYTSSEDPLTKSIHLSLKLDFESNVIHGVATLNLSSKASGKLNLDTRDLSIHQIVDQANNQLSFELSATSDPIKGRLLTVFLWDNVVKITYSTSKNASAIQWLAPEQTAGGQVAYMFTQCQPIHARSVFPCQDTPQARVQYKAEVEVALGTRVVMGAAHIRREEGEKSAVEFFEMNQPIPPYLFAMAAGDIAHRDISHRVRVYAEPSVVDSAAAEFEDTEAMVATAESLFGRYDWDRFDILVMPPSFPYGGMENPRMTFLTPTVITGDKSLVGVVAHELAHSWTGNLVTNASANDFWLNEGWTTYAERRIQEALEGEEKYQLHAAIGWNSLQGTLDQFKGHPELTLLKMSLEGVDPDEVYSTVPYEKGFLFVKLLELSVGREAFDPFIRKYISSFRFQSISTETFIHFLTENLPQVSQLVDLQQWVHGDGLPGDAPKPTSGILNDIKTAANKFANGAALEEDYVQKWGAIEWQNFLGSLPNRLEAAKVEELDERFQFSSSANFEIRCGLLKIAAYSAYKPLLGAVEETLFVVGRMKYLKPLYVGLIQGGNVDLAADIFQRAKRKYHSIAAQVITGLFKKVGVQV